MSHRPITSLAAAFLATSVAAADVTIIDQFDDSVLDGWNLFPGTPAFGSITATGGRLRMTSFNELPASGCAVGLAASWIPAYADPDSISNGIFRWQFRPQNMVTLGSFAIRDNVELGVEGYQFTLDAATQTIAIRVADEAQCIYPVLAETPFAVGVNVDYQFEAVADGTELSLKVWPVGTEEPAAPQLVASDDTFFSGGLFVSSVLGIGVSGRINGSFDNLTYEPLPDPVEGDLDGDGVVNAADLALLLGQWGAGCNGCAADLSQDGIVDAADLTILLGSWSA